MKSLRNTGSPAAARAARKMIELPWKRRRVGQYREAGRAAGLVGAS